MAIGPFSGFIRGFGNRTASLREERARETERQMARDQRALELLATSDDPEIANAAISGLGSLATGAYQPKSGLGKFLGSAGQANPEVVRVFDLIRKGIEIPGVDVSVPPSAGAMSDAAAQTTGPAPAAMAPPPGEGSGIQPGRLPGGSTTPGGAPPSIETLMAEVAGRVSPATSQVPALSQPAGARTVQTPGVTRPRQVFLPADQRIRRDTRAREQAQYEAEREALQTAFIQAGDSPEDAARRAAEAIAAKYERAALGTGAPFQSVAGELPDGTQVFGTFDRTTGQHLDQNGEVLVGFRPRQTTGSTSMGVTREAIARAEYGKPYVQLTPAEQQRVLELETARVAQTAGARTTATAEAAAAGPLSAANRATFERGLQADWRTINAPEREMARQQQIMRVALDRFKAGDKIGGSQGVLVTFQRILDPESVVRESEYARTPEGLGLLQRFQGYIDRLTEGGAGVPEAELAAMVETADQFVAQLAGWNDQARQRIESTATAYGIPIERVTGGGSGGEGGGGGAAAPTGLTPPPAGTVPAPGSTGQSLDLTDLAPESQQLVLTQVNAAPIVAGDDYADVVFRNPAGEVVLTIRKWRDGRLERIR